MAVKEKIRVRLKSYDHTLIDTAAEKIVTGAKANGSEVSGPIPLPTEREIVTILRAVHKYKDSREQFEMRTHKRLIDIIKPNQKTIDALMNVELPAGGEMCRPGDNVDMTVELIKPIACEKGLRFAIRVGGRTVGSGVVSEILA